MRSAHAWNVAAYEAFHDLRLRPALDLLARVPLADDDDAGPVVDLGCGSGAAAPHLRRRFPNARLIGLDASTDMLERAGARGVYDELVEANLANWSPPSAPSLIFSNAALHWLPNHAALIPRLFAALRPGGAFAAQMPGQLKRASHATMIDAARRVRPDLFSGWTPVPGPLPLPAYNDLLGNAEIDLWETEYWQDLAPDPDGAHPVRAFVSSTGARPILSRLNPAETVRFETLWDAALAEAYPRRADGGCWFPFRRLFFVVRRPA